jgi:hypothetical protein
VELTSQTEHEIDRYRTLNPEHQAGMPLEPHNAEPRIWRSLAEIGAAEPPPALVELSIDREGYVAGLDRREFLGWLGASLALAGAGGCGFQQPAETIVPYA